MRERGIVVVGAGPAGVAAAVQCMRLGEEPVVLDESGRAGGLVRNGFLVENYPGLEGPLPGEIVAARIAEHLGRFGVQVRKERVTRVEPLARGFVVRSSEGERKALAVLLCTGTVSRRLPVAGSEAPGPDRLFSEVRALLEAISTPRTVLVIGGGEAAFDSSLTLAAAGAEVRILIRGPRPRARGRLLEMVGDVPEIRVETRTTVEALAPREDGVEASVAGPEARERTRADAVLAAIGRESTVGSLVAGLESRTGEIGLTPLPGLFICGDSRRRGLGQVGIAVGDGLAAAAGAVEHVLGGGTA